MGGTTAWVVTDLSERSQRRFAGKKRLGVIARHRSRGQHRGQRIALYHDAPGAGRWRLDGYRCSSERLASFGAGGSATLPLEPLLA